MSLINKVLLDLDNRTQGGGAVAANHSLFSNLHPVGVPPSSSPPQWLWPLIACLLTLSLGGGWYYQGMERAAPAEAPASHAPPAAKVADTARTTGSAPTPAVPAPAAKPKPATAAVADKPLATAPAKHSETATARPAPVKAPPPPAAPARQQHKASVPAPAPTVATKEEPDLERTLRPPTPEERAEALYRKGVGLLRSGQDHKGERALQSALAIDPSHTAARETLTVVYLEKRRLEAAKHLLAEGIAMRPGYAPFSSRLARIYVEQGDETRALQLLESKRAQIKPDGAYFGLLGTLYQRASRHEEARDAFRQALSLQADDGRWWMGLGISLEALRDWAAARDAYQRCLMITKTEPRVRQYAQQRLNIVARHLP